jgi:hypothetical protein
MAATVQMIGLDPTELTAVRTLVNLLRHPDPRVPNLARQALSYVQDSAKSPDWSKPA